MRQHEPPRLAHLDAQRAAWLVVRYVHYRAQRDTSRLGLAHKVSGTSVPGGQDEVAHMNQALGQSRVYRTAQTCTEWAVTGRGKPEAVLAALKELRADLDGIDVGDAPLRAPDLTTTPGVVVVAAAARLALVDGRTVDVVDVATLASVDERTIRAAVQAGALRPLSKRRPMRFAADLVRAYLYARGVQGFAGPLEPEVTQALTG